jgi:2-oxoglutarate dehydrogenase E1 component
LVFCTGKFYYDLLIQREKLENDTVALIRVEQLFPLHKEKIKEIIAKYPNVEKYIWAQEEPKNMGAWSHMLQRFDFVKLEGYSRPYSSVPAPGSSTRDKKRQQNVIDAVFQAL